MTKGKLEWMTPELVKLKRDSRRINGICNPGSGDNMACTALGNAAGTALCVAGFLVNNPQCGVGNAPV